MLELFDSPTNVLAFRAVGRIDKSDYQAVLEPAVHAMIAELGEVRLVYVLGAEFEGYSIAAEWEDAKLGIGIVSKWRRCAVVTGHEWLRHAIGVFGWMMPGEIRVFDESDVHSALHWAAT